MFTNGEQVNIVLPWLLTAHAPARPVRPGGVRAAPDAYEPGHDVLTPGERIPQPRVLQV